LKTGEEPEFNIEFSSKNLSSENPLFSNTKENTLNNYLTNNANNRKNSNLGVRSGYGINTPPVNKLFQTASETKINDYFKSNNNSNTLPVCGDTDKNTKMLKDKVSKLSDENEKLHKEILSKNKFIIEKDKDNERLKLVVRDNEENLWNLNILVKQQENQLGLSKISLVRFLKELEEYKKQQKKIWLNEQTLKLGKFVLQRAGNTIIEAWEEGEELAKAKLRHHNIIVEKEELEKLRRRLAHYKNKEKSLSLSDNVLGENVEIGLDEQKELVNFKVFSLNREENEIREKIERLEYEKILYQIEYKRQIEEEKCRYGSGRSKDRWPVLSNRYLILSLLGKGGYSEVYKVYK
jgi:tousled-like kinase